LNTEGFLWWSKDEEEHNDFYITKTEPQKNQPFMESAEEFQRNGYLPELPLNLLLLNTKQEVLNNQTNGNTTR
jgi:hypothetical protein